MVFKSGFEPWNKGKLLSEEHKEKGWMVLRFGESEINNDLSKIVEIIQERMRSD